MNNTAMSTKLAMLHDYSKAGWVVFPLRPIAYQDGAPYCACGKPGCPGVGKHPAWKWTQLHAPLSASELEDAHRRDITRGWAVHLGPSSLCVIDVDPRNGGEEGLRQLESVYGRLPRDLVCATGGGGLHFYYQAPANLPPKTFIPLAPGVELLSGQHISIIPPSRHRSGKLYRWITSEDTISPVPQAILDAALAIAAASEASSRPMNDAAAVCDRLHDFGKIQARARAYLATLPPAVQGQNGSGACFRAACSLVLGFDLRPDEAYPLLVEYSDRCQPPWSEAELRHKLESANAKTGPRGDLRDAKPSAEAMARRQAHRFAAIDAEIADVPDSIVKRLRCAPQDGAEAAAEPEAAQTVDERRAANPHLRFGGENAINTDFEDRDSAVFSRGTPPCTRHVLGRRRDATGEGAIFSVVCHTWDCPYCIQELKQIYLSAMSTHLANEPAEIEFHTAIVELTDPDMKDWKQLYNKIRRTKDALGRPGRYVCIRKCAFVSGDKYFVVATVAFPGSAPALREVAIDEMCQTIKEITLGRKPISKAREYDLPKKELPPQYERIGEVLPSVSLGEAIDVLEKHGIHVESARPKNAGGGSNRKLAKMLKFNYRKHLDHEDELWSQTKAGIWMPFAPPGADRPTEAWAMDFGDGEDGGLGPPQME